MFYGTALFMAAILLGIWTNNKRLDDMKLSLNKRIDDLVITMNTGFADVKTSITEVKTSIARLETRVSDLEKSSHLIRG